MQSNAHEGGAVQTAPPKVLILGVGNILLTDDGFGVHFIKELSNTPLPPNVTALEAGTVSHALIPAFHDVDHLIVIDAVEAGDKPGALFRFGPEDMEFASEQKVSLHQISLVDVLTMTALTGASPKTIIIGVQPKDTTSWSTELSDELKAVMPRVKELVFKELNEIKSLPIER